MSNAQPNAATQANDEWEQYFAIERDAWSTAECFKALAKNVNVQNANKAMSPGMEVSLFDCLSDVPGCLITYCCGCVVAGFNSARLDDRECTPCDIFANDYQTRQSMRGKYGMGYAPLPDFISLYCCHFCFVMQTAKELALKRGDEPVYFGEVGMNIMGDR